MTVGRAYIIITYRVGTRGVLIGVFQPHFERNLQEGVVQEIFEMLADGLGRGRFHFLDNLRGVFVQEHVHRFACVKRNEQNTI